MSDTSSTPSAPTASSKEPPFEVPVKSMKSGGSNFRTARLHIVNADRSMVEPTIQWKMFYGVFFLMALLFIGIGASKLSSRLWFGLAFAAGGVFTLVLMLYWYKKDFRAVVFDRHAGVCYALIAGRAPVRHRLALNNIVGLQIIAEWHSSSQAPDYYSYELNLVLDEPRGARFHVMKTGHRQGCFDDARKLAEFLDRPLWDQTAGA